jgi:tetratricopeptide (TPR) repeat protein
LKSINRSEQGDEDAVRELLHKAIEVDPRYFATYLNLGFSYLNAGEIDKAIECYKKAYDLEPSFARTNNNLGGCYLITARFDKAIEHLERANKTAAALITQLLLGEAYRYAGRLADALRLHEIASSKIETKGIENERYTLGDWTWVFMPLHEGDTETIRQSVRVWTFPQKKMLTYHALAFDRALNGQRTKANNAFNLGRDCDKEGDYNAFFVNRIESILNFVKPSPEARGWFEEKNKALSSPAA